MKYTARSWLSHWKKNILQDWYTAESSCKVNFGSLSIGFHPVNIVASALLKSSHFSCSDHHRKCIWDHLLEFCFSDNSIDIVFSFNSLVYGETEKRWVSLWIKFLVCFVIGAKAIYYMIYSIHCTWCWWCKSDILIFYNDLRT